MSRFRKTNYVSDSSTVEVAIPEMAVREVARAAQEKSQLTQRVLLLDDETALREAVSEYLATCLFHVTAVSNGAEGLREVVKDPFDVILCDMMMPKLNGEMFYWAVTRLRPAAGRRFIFITGHQNDPAIQSFFARIDAVVLTKPFRLDDLRKVIHQVLARLR